MYKKLIEKRKVICFDLDETIVRTKGLWLEAYRNVLKNLNIEPTIPMYTFTETGTSIENTWEAFIKANQEQVDSHLTVQELTKAVKNEFLKLLDETELEVIDGFWELFAELKLDKKLEVAIVTNTPKDVGTKVIDKLGIDEELIDLKLFGDDVENPKPDPEIYQKLINHFKVKPKEILVFEDSVVGATAAAGAKLDMVIIYSQEKQREEYPGEIRAFSYDFTPFPGNFEETKSEVWDRVVDHINKKIKSKQ